MKKNYNKIINQIQKIRSKNNVNWMNILKLAFKLDPVNASKIMKKINYDDKKISNLLNKLSKVEVTIEAQVGDEDKMFGSITAIDIQKSLKEKGLIVDRNTIMLDSPIKSLGIFHVKVKLSTDNECDVKVYVIRS